MPGRRSSPEGASPRGSRRRGPGLFARFLLILTPVYLAVSVPGIVYLLHSEFRSDQEALAARIGNQAARAAAALARHDLAQDPRLAYDLLAPLAADRAFLGAELLDGRDGRVLVALPQAQGCSKVAAASEIVLPVRAEDGSRLRVCFTDAELDADSRLEGSLIISLVGFAFFSALLAATIGFRFIIGRPLRLLLAAIRISTETGRRTLVGLRRTDELGDLIKAFDEMVRRDNAREAALTEANDRLEASKAELSLLNRELEARVAERTKALEAETRRAEAANEAKSRFLWSMNHELRTPLNAIIGFAETMQLQAFGPLGERRYEEFATDIRDSGQHLLGIINAILDIAKIESGSETLDEEELDGDALIDDTLRMVRPMSAAAGIRLAYRPAARPLRLRADGVKMKRILINLLGNAVKFTPAGGDVELTVAHSEAGVEFVVRDTGIGMRKDDIPNALAAFGQIDDGLARRFPGTGLGLPLARMLAELHGGALVIDSRLGEGTRVTVRLPAERVIRSGPAAA